jgi:hypothetical protein
MILLFVIFALELLFDLTHHLSLLKSPLLLQIKLSPELDHLVLLNHGLVVEDLSEFLLVSLELLNILVHLLGLLAQTLGLVSELLVLTLKKGHFFL